MLLANGKWHDDGIPTSLPCGTSINQNWRRGKPVECCRTVCPDKTDKTIDECHKENKRKNRKAEFEPPTEGVQ